MNAIAWGPALVSGGVALLTAVAGGLLTRLGPWYDALEKPSWQPPDWLFGPAWTLIFTLCAISGYVAWQAADTSGARQLVLVLFLSNAVINAAWSGLFFAMRRPDWALIEVGFLWASILLMVVLLLRIDLFASLLLVPYLAWVSFAAFLNLTIVRLNGPFGV